MHPKSEPSAMLAPYFLGAYGENNDALERILIELLRDHVYWRRNFHPEDEPAIDTATQYSPEYHAALAATKRELHQLTSQLKRSVPFFHPRYIGHMASDLLLPGLIAQLVTTLYNPNNIVEDAAPVTVKLELEVGRQLAAMLGYNTDPARSRVALGHLTSGGTVANYEALWLARAVKYFAVALRTVCADQDVGLLLSDSTALATLDDYQAFNLPVSAIVTLKDMFGQHLQGQSPVRRRMLVQALDAQRVESLGSVAFAARHPQVATPLVMVPGTAHYSWQKAMKLLGLGTAQLREMATRGMRLDAADVQHQLRAAHDQRQPVLAVIGVLGSTEFGTIDPLHELVALRRDARRAGQDFWLHVDAAWGGYLPSLFRDAQGRLRPHAAVRAEHRYFPSSHVYESVAALEDSDSVTVDPHKLGFVPFGAGAFIARERRVFDCVTQDAAYVFTDGDLDDESRYRHIGRYILEGSKPGAAAAACYVNHRVLPLHSDGFGRLVRRSVHNAEACHDLFRQLAVQLRDRVHLAMPFEPDCNLICLMLNPVGNRQLAVANAFGRRVFEHMKVDARLPLQTREFFGSCTSISREQLCDDDVAQVCSSLQIDSGSFVASNAELTPGAAHEVFVLRHTLMNPWLQSSPQAGAENYLALYAAYLTDVVDRLLSDVSAG